MFCAGVGVPLLQPQPHCVPLVGNPAFCFGCMQVGTMYRIDSVLAAQPTNIKIYIEDIGSNQRQYP